MSDGTDLFVQEMDALTVDQDAQAESFFDGDESQSEQAKPENKVVDNGDKVETVAPGKGQPEQPKAPEVDQYIKEFYSGEGDDFDTDKALNFLKSGSFQYERPQARKQEPAGVEQLAQSQQMQQPKLSYEDTYRSNMGLGLKLLQDYVQSGMDVNQAFIQAQYAIEHNVAEHLKQKEIEKLREENRKEIEGVKSMAEMQTLKSKADANIYNIAKSSGMTVDQFMNAIYDPKYGGQFINAMYDAYNPNKGAPTEQELSNWWARFASNPVNAQMVASFTKAKIQERLFPQIVEKIRRAGAQNTAQKMAGKVSAPNNRQAETKQKTPDDLDKYFGLTEI